MKNSSETKRKLIDITRQMIDKGGINSISMRDIGRELNLSRSAVYRHFKSKEDLLATVVAENFEMLRNDILILIEKINEPKKLIYELLSTYYNFGIKNREHYKLMFGREWDKEQYPNLHASALGIFKIVEQYLEKAQEQKCSLRKPIKEVTAIMYAFIRGLVEINFSGHSEPEKGLDDPNRLINSFLDTILV